MEKVFKNLIYTHNQCCTLIMQTLRIIYSAQHHQDKNSRNCKALSGNLPAGIETPLNHFLELLVIKESKLGSLNIWGAVQISQLGILISDHHKNLQISLQLPGKNGFHLDRRRELLLQIYSSQKKERKKQQAARRRKATQPAIYTC